MNERPFDPNTFMQETIDAPLETEFRLIPEAEYQAMIGDFDGNAFEQIDFTFPASSKRAGQQGTMRKFSCPFVISNDPRIMAELGRDTATAFANITLDVDAAGKLESGPNKNVRLGQIREAVGQNTPGPWQFSSLRGAGPVMIRVVHRSYQRKDGSPGKNAEVDRVVPIR